jgi:hypothetical protein
MLEPSGRHRCRPRHSNAAVTSRSPAVTGRRRRPTAGSRRRPCAAAAHRPTAPTGRRRDAAICRRLDEPERRLPQRTSMSNPVGTALPAWTAITASSATCRRPASSSQRPPAHTSIGASIRSLATARPPPGDPYQPCTPRRTAATRRGAGSAHMLHVLTLPYLLRRRSLAGRSER